MNHKNGVLVDMFGLFLSCFYLLCYVAHVPNLFDVVSKFVEQ